MPKTRDKVRLDAEAHDNCPPVETAQSPGDDTHAAVARPKERESTDHELSVVLCVGGLRTWPIDRCLNKKVGRGERKTPTACKKKKKGSDTRRIFLDVQGRTCAPNLKT